MPTTTPTKHASPADLQRWDSKAKALMSGMEKSNIVKEIDRALEHGTNGPLTNNERVKYLQLTIQESKDSKIVKDAIVEFFRYKIDDRTKESGELVRLVHTARFDDPDRFGDVESMYSVRWNDADLKELSDEHYAGLVDRVLELLAQFPLDSLKRMYRVLSDPNGVTLQFSDDYRMAALVGEVEESRNPADVRAAMLEILRSSIAHGDSQALAALVATARFEAGDIFGRQDAGDVLFLGAHDFDRLDVQQYAATVARVMELLNETETDALRQIFESLHGRRDVVEERGPMQFSLSDADAPTRPARKPAAAPPLYEVLPDGSRWEVNPKKRALFAGKPIK